VKALGFGRQKRLIQLNFWQTLQFRSFLNLIILGGFNSYWPREGISKAYRQQRPSGAGV
jgi:hypothetical protein